MLPAIIAHRANGFGALENTLPAFKALAKSPIRGVEFDVWLTADRQPIVHHDLHVDIHGQKRALRHLSHHELPPNIPLLADVAASVAKLDFVNIEIKPGSFALTRIWPFLRAKNICVSSFRWQTLANLRSHDSNLRLGLLVPERRSPAQAVQAATELACEALHLSFWQLGPAWLTAARAANLPIRVYTVNHHWQWRLCLSLGIDAMMTDKPLQLLAWLQKQHPPRSRS